MIDRRKFLAGSVAASTTAATFLTTSSLSGQEKENAKKQETPPAPAQLDPQLVKRFVGSSHGNFKGVKELFAKEPQLIHASWDWVNGDFETGLGAASHVGHRDIANFLLDKGARIDVFAMTMLGHVDLVKPIVKAFPRTHAVPGPHGIPLLSHAIFGREKADDVFELILESGADVNQASNAKQTPLMAAASVGRPEWIKVLLKKNADPNLKDGKQRTALDYARSRKRDEAIAILEKITDK